MELVVQGVRTDDSQFQYVPATATHPAVLLHAGCGPDAAAKAARWADQSLSSPSMIDVYRKMRSLGLGGANGTSTLWDLEQTLRKLGYTIILPNSGESVAAFLRRMDGVYATVWETGNGQALRDYVTGLGEDATNLVYHFVCRFGHNSGGASAFTTKAVPAGAWHGDGDSDAQNMRNGVRYHWPINRRMEFYPDSVVAAARPIGAFAVKNRAALPGTGPIGASSMLQLTDPKVAQYFAASGADWKVKSSGVTLPAAGGFLDFYRSVPTSPAVPYGALDLFGLPTANPFPSTKFPGVMLQPFELCGLASDAKHVMDNRPGMSSPVYPVHIDSGEMQAYLAGPLTGKLQASLNTANAMLEAARAALAGVVKALG